MRALEIAPRPHLIAVGDQGTLAGRPFEVLGRVQLDHGLGPWDEYYVAFDYGQTWGWLAYAQAAEVARTGLGREGRARADYGPGRTASGSAKFFQDVAHDQVALDVERLMASQSAQACGRTGDDAPTVM